ncbi:MAG: rRNA maturation RNase YbeY [Pseudomonadota bacterium]
MQIELQIAISDPAPVPDADAVTRWISRTLALAGRADSQCSLCIRVVDGAEGQTLNRQYRGFDKPTNVLSFPALPHDGLPAVLPPELLAELPLGDLVLCWPVIEAEAVAQGKRLEDHCAHLLVHGTLHLLGYDHEAPAAAAAMEALEVAVLAQFSIADPYLIHPSGEVVS